jgi:Aldehyde dehydrogenase family
MFHVPVLRRGVPYRSLDTVRTPHYQTRENFVEISHANVGLIRKDLLAQGAAKRALDAYSVADLIGICHCAAEHFLHDTLPIGDDPQTPDEYVRSVSATTALPHALVRRNMSKMYGVMAEMESVLSGLTRRLDLRVLDSGFASDQGTAVSFFPRASALGVVLPSNSPGVHSLWIPAFAMKVPLMLKPGGAEPWTPYRLIQALMKAGAPPDAFGFYPCDHAGAGEILRQCGRGMVFGDVSSTRIWQNDPRVEVHGPGYSKVFIGEDEIDNWEQHLDVMAASIAGNSGRSCVNASGIWVPRHGREIAEALAERFAQIVPRTADDPDAELAPFADPNVAARISSIIDADLSQAGATDLSAARRGSERVAKFDNASYLLPTVVEAAIDHPLANREFLFPFASVVEVDPAQAPEALGPTLVLTAITNDPAIRRRLLSSPLVGRLNLGAIPTNHISWDQPHEGNLFDHLYARRAFQAA